MFKILIKFEGNCFAVDVDSSWTVRCLKRELCRCHVGTNDNILVEDLDVIFCGRLLRDDVKLHDCQLQEVSTVFATRRAKRQQQASDDVNSQRDCEDVTSMSQLDTRMDASLYMSLEERFTDLESGEREEDTEQKDVEVGSELPKPRLYVYCKDPCQSAQPGKLRVCCHQCKDGAFVVDQHPTCWDDVLVSLRIRGRCQANECFGTVAEFYFKCGIHQTLDDDRVVALYLIKSNTRSVVCLTCADIRSPVLVFPCAAGHTLCLECFVAYCRVRLDERRFTTTAEIGYTLSCPVGCPDSFIKETHHFRLLGAEQYSRYQQFAAEECVLRDGGVLCPSPGCGAGLVPDPGSRRRVECVQQAGLGCGFVFCRDCRDPYHDGVCDPPVLSTSGSDRVYRPVDRDRASLAQWEADCSRQTIRDTTKPCPKCLVPTEKNGGCMHMVCPQQHCGFQWCWLCTTEWSRTCMANHWFDVN